MTGGYRVDIKEKARTYYADTVELRRTLHRHPEISGQEKRTSQFVKSKLEEYGISYRELPRYGILGTIEGRRPGKTVALRADMDALPIQELSETAYRSQEANCGHLCGHDCHTASLLTAARILNEYRDDMAGKVVLMFQPSEENSGFGAADMIEHGAMENVDAVFGVHVLNSIRAGQVSVQPGPRMAASFRVDIEVSGVGGHGGMPHKCVDAVVAACAIVMNLQSVVSREMDPQDSVAVTVGTFHGGSSRFVISDQAKMELTVKFFRAELAEQLKECITRIATDTANAYRARCSVKISHYFRPVVNDPGLSALAERSLRKLYGDGVAVTCAPWGASEDYSEYTACAPGLFAFVGGRNEEKGFIHSPHHPCFDVDELCLERASALYAQFAWDFLHE